MGIIPAQKDFVYEMYSLGEEVLNIRWRVFKKGHDIRQGSGHIKCREFEVQHFPIPR